MVYYTGIYELLSSTAIPRGCLTRLFHTCCHFVVLKRTFQQTLVTLDVFKEYLTVRYVDLLLAQVVKSAENVFGGEKKLMG